METISIQVSLREKLGTRESRRLRKSNMVPAVLYGGKKDNEMLLLSKKEAMKLVGHGSRMIELVVADRKEKVLVKDVEYSSLVDSVIHIDFARVALDVMLTISVEIALKGTPKGLKAGGVLDHSLRTLTVKCLPLAIPEKIEVDINNLELDNIIRVKDIVLPAGVSTSVNPDIAVASVHLPKVEEIPVVAPTEVSVEPEVITAKKPAEEGEENAAGEKGVPAPKEKEHKDKDKGK